jgi:hypothetical protein
VRFSTSGTTSPTFSRIRPNVLFVVLAYYVNDVINAVHRLPGKSSAADLKCLEANLLIGRSVRPASTATPIIGPGIISLIRRSTFVVVLRFVGLRLFLPKSYATGLNQNDICFFKSSDPSRGGVAYEERCRRRLQREKRAKNSEEHHSSGGLLTATASLAAGSLTISMSRNFVSANGSSLSATVPEFQPANPFRKSDNLPSSHQSTSQSSANL